MFEERRIFSTVFCAFFHDFNVISSNSRSHYMALLYQHVQAPVYVYDNSLRSYLTTLS
jgi:hypothetical protein